MVYFRQPKSHELFYQLKNMMITNQLESTRFVFDHLIEKRKAELRKYVCSDTIESWMKIIEDEVKKTVKECNGTYYKQ